jgi:RNA polymerase sigma-70 factor (ECF subfamily)
VQGAESDDWDWSLIRRHCVGEARRVLRSQQDVEEAVQEALLRAWKSRHSCRTPRAPIAWCRQITRHEALRRIERRRPTLGLGSLEIAAIEDASAAEEAARVVARVDVHRALAELAPQERVLIALRYAYDCSQPEVARRLRIPEGTAKVRLHRARRQLKNLMEEPG